MSPSTRSLSVQIRRRTERAYAREAEQRRRAELDRLMARMLRRVPDLDREEAERAASAMLSSGSNVLAHRSPPVPYRGWRKDRARMEHLLHPLAGAGLPLAAEGGAPFRCLDRVTSDLSMANYRRKRAA